MKGERNLQRMENWKGNLPDVKGWTVKDDHGEAVGKVQALWMERQKEHPRYVEVKLENNKKGNNIAIPVGLLQRTETDSTLQVDNLDRQTLENAPAFKNDEEISYRDEMSIRAYFEDPDKVYTKTGKDNTGASVSNKDRSGEINSQYTSTMEAGTAMPQDERRLADEMQGRYKPNTSGDAEGVKSPATNPEGKHDIAAVSGNPEDTRSGDYSRQSSDNAPRGIEQITSDKPGATVGRDEVENEGNLGSQGTFKDQTGPTDTPLNANEDFYKHPMFESSYLK